LTYRDRVDLGAAQMHDDSNVSGAFRKPPLGPLPDLDREEKAKSLEASRIPYTRIDADYRLFERFRDLVEFAQSFLAEYGMRFSGVAVESVHLLDNASMDRVLKLLDASEENGGGIYDSRADVVYVRQLDPHHTLADRIKFFYALAHEVGHKLIRGLNGVVLSTDYSAILNEGIADWFAQRFMHELYLQKYAPEMFTRITDAFRDQPNPFDLNGLAIRPDEVWLIDADTGYGSLFSRIVESRIVKELERVMGARDFNRLMRATTTGTAEEVREVVVATNGGIDLWSVLTTDPEQRPLIEVLHAVKNSPSVGRLWTPVNDPPTVG
jgi:hypothetical protein